jgi:HD-GYP domain-containing protein (c-di-GMP phosphodiesterase class II)
MREHTVVGARMLERIPYFVDVHPLVRCSHERWDGGGYPDGLVGAEIPLGSRVIAACDAFHAMTSDRPYRKAMSPQQAVAELELGRGAQFDPQVISALLAVLDVPAGDVIELRTTSG